MRETALASAYGEKGRSIMNRELQYYREVTRQLSALRYSYIAQFIEEKREK